MSDSGGSDSTFAYVLGRCVLLAFWSLVLWGTCYAVVWMQAAIAMGPEQALRQALMGKDRAAALANIASAVLAAIVWTVVATALVARRRQARERD